MYEKKVLHHTLKRERYLVPIQSVLDRAEEQGTILNDPVMICVLLQTTSSALLGVCCTNRAWMKKCIHQDHQPNSHSLDGLYCVQVPGIGRRGIVVQDHRGRQKWAEALFQDRTRMPYGFMVQQTTTATALETLEEAFKRYLQSLKDRDG
jgi:gamma-glutamyltranspeptidase